jgi:hypothetical protein
MRRLKNDEVDVALVLVLVLVVFVDRNGNLHLVPR